MTLLQLTYISRATERFSSRELPELIEHATEKNRRLGLTGALYHAAGRFIQVLEGDDETVRALYATILADPRHTEVETVAMRSIETRCFEQRSMGALSPSLAARAAKEAFRQSHCGTSAWSDETLDAILSEFQAALKQSPTA